MAKTAFGVIAPNLTRPYTGDTAIGAGLAVVAGASAGSVALPGGANVRALGVTGLASANAGDPLPVVELGEVTAIADTAITRGQWVIVNAATGQLAPIANVAGGEFEVVGLALESATAQGDEFLLFVLPHRMLDNASSPTFASLTLSGLLKESAADNIVAFAGGGKASATAMTAEINRIITVATEGDSVLLPPSQNGLTVLVLNHGANGAQVFGAGADTINDIAAATGVRQMPGSVVLYICDTAGAWYTEGLATGYDSGGRQTIWTLGGITAFAGGGKASATPLAAQWNRVTTVATAGDSVLLPPAVPGLPVTVINAGANDMQVYGQGTDTINGIATATGISQPRGSVAVYTCGAAGAWETNSVGQGFSAQFPTVSANNNITAFAGGGQASATLLTAVINRVTTVASAGDSVKLAVCKKGMQQTVSNAAAANSMNVFPSSGDQINALGVNAAFAVAAGKTANFSSAADGQWHAVLSA